MSVNIELAVILSTAGHSEIIKKLNHDEELSQPEILLIFNTLAKRIERIERKSQSIGK
ncbi:hypothetical protein KAK05_02645 [Candidatus Parcubacteria bacterium]|nr:hypothetical protein [Candidatus Parcubacteria bacterium]